MKKFFITLGIIISVISIALAIYFGITSNESYNKGYDDGAGDLTAYEQVIEDCQNTIESISIDYENTKIELAETQTKLNNSLNQNAQDKETITNLTNKVEKLTTQLSEMQEKINYYEELLQDAGFNGYKLNFYADSKLYLICFVKENTDLSDLVSSPEKTGFEFLGWSTDETEENIIDLNTLEIVEDTNLYAIFKDIRTWHTVLSEPDENYAVQGKAGNQIIINVEGLTPDSIYKVNFSTFNFTLTNLITATESYSFKNENGQVVTENGNSIKKPEYHFTLFDNDVIKAEDSYGYYAFSVDCLENNKLIISFNFNTSLSVLCYLNAVYIDSIEILY